GAAGHLADALRFAHNLEFAPSPEALAIGLRAELMALDGIRRWAVHPRQTAKRLAAMAGEPTVGVSRVFVERAPADRPRRCLATPPAVADPVERWLPWERARARRVIALLLSRERSRLKESIVFLPFPAREDRGEKLAALPIDRWAATSL